jgi:hypothetical protein
MFAAQALGLGSTPMIGFDPVGVVRELSLTLDEVPVMLVAVGRIECLMRLQALRRGRDRVAFPLMRVNVRQAPCCQCARPRLRSGCFQPQMDRRLHICLDGGSLALCGNRHRSVLSARGNSARRGKPDALLHHSDWGSQVHQRRAMASQLVCLYAPESSQCVRWCYIPVGIANSAPSVVLSGQRCMIDFYRV